MSTDMTGFAVVADANDWYKIFAPAIIVDKLYSKIQSYGTRGLFSILLSTWKFIWVFG
jgi:hypothetical protein